MLQQKYIVKQTNVCRGYNRSRGDKSAVRNAEFRWHKFQWGVTGEWVSCSVLINNFISASWRSSDNV